MNSKIMSWVWGLLCIFSIAFSFYRINEVDVRHFTDDDIIAINETQFQQAYQYLKDNGVLKLTDSNCNLYYFAAEKTRRSDHLKEGIGIPYITVSAWHNGITTGENFFYFDIISTRVTSAVKEIFTDDAAQGYQELMVVTSNWKIM